MNIFALSIDPTKAARMMCDKHIPKMIVESAQMMASALRRHEDTLMKGFPQYESVDDLFTQKQIVTKKGTPYKGGYANHPCTVWAGDTWANFYWLGEHACGLLREFRLRFGERSVEHACSTPIKQMLRLGIFVGDVLSEKTAFAMAMPDEYKQEGKEVIAYRDYYFAEKGDFAKWQRGREAPTWWIAKRRTQMVEAQTQYDAYSRVSVGSAWPNWRVD